MRANHMVSGNMHLIVFIFVCTIIKVRANFYCGQYTHCNIMPWAAWSPCSVTCGAGIKQRNKPVCCDPAIVQPLSLPMCMQACRIPVHYYMNNGMERTKCGVCGHGNFNSVTNTCDCHTGFGGNCCEQVVTTTTNTLRSNTSPKTTTTPKSTTRPTPTTHPTTRKPTTLKPTTQPTTRIPTTTPTTPKPTTHPTTRKPTTTPTTQKPTTHSTTRKPTTTPTTPKPTTHSTTRKPTTTPTTPKPTTHSTTRKPTTTPTTPKPTTHSTTRKPTTTPTTPKPTTHPTIRKPTTTPTTPKPTTHPTTPRPFTLPTTLKPIQTLTTTRVKTVLIKTTSEQAAASTNHLRHKIMRGNRTNSCDSDPCKHGTCVDIGDRFECDCLAMARGTTCEEIEPWFIGLLTTSSLGLVCLLCCCLKFLVLKKSDDNEERNKKSSVHPVQLTPVEKFSA